MGSVVSREFSDHVHFGMCRIARLGPVSCGHNRAIYCDCAWVRRSSYFGQIQVSAANYALHWSRVISCRNCLSVHSDMALCIRRHQLTRNLDQTTINTILLYLGFLALSLHRITWTNCPRSLDYPTFAVKPRDLY